MIALGIMGDVVGVGEVVGVGDVVDTGDLVVADDSVVAGGAVVEPAPSHPARAATTSHDAPRIERPTHIAPIPFPVVAPRSITHDVQRRCLF